MHQKGINFALNTSSCFVISPNKYLENVELSIFRYMFVLFS
jgi:hypothetical protein